LSEIKPSNIRCIKGEDGFLGKGTYAKVVLGFYNDSLIAAKCSKFYGSKLQKQFLGERYEKP